MLLSFLYSLGLSSLGLIIYFAWKAEYYLRKGKFSFKTWSNENLHKFIYSFILLALLIMLLTLSPSSKDSIFAILGIDFNIEKASPELLGAIVGASIYSVDKKIKKEQQTL